MSDGLFLHIGLVPALLLPRLYIQRHEERVVAMVTKIVDELLLKGVPHIIPDIIVQMADGFTFGTVSQDPGYSVFFGLNIKQADNMSFTIVGDDTLNGIAHMARLASSWVRWNKISIQWSGTRLPLSMP